MDLPGNTLRWAVVELEGVYRVEQFTPNHFTDIPERTNYRTDGVHDGVHNFPRGATDGTPGGLPQIVTDPSPSHATTKRGAARFTYSPHDSLSRPRA